MAGERFSIADQADASGLLSPARPTRLSERIHGTPLTAVDSIQTVFRRPIIIKRRFYEIPDRLSGMLNNHV